MANVINIGADLGAMVAALKLTIDGPSIVYVGMFAIVSVLLEVFIRSTRFATTLTWVTL